MAGLSARASLLGVLAVGAGAQAADVDLAKAIGPADGGWNGRRVGEVIEVDAIERVVLLRALTSTTGGHDLANIRRMLGAAAPQPFLAGPAPHAGSATGIADSVWEAVILTRDGAAFGFSADAARACLRGPDGRSGCFAAPAHGTDPGRPLPSVP